MAHTSRMPVVCLILCAMIFACVGCAANTKQEPTSAAIPSDAVVDTNQGAEGEYTGVDSGLPYQDPSELMTPTQFAVDLGEQQGIYPSDLSKPIYELNVHRSAVDMQKVITAFYQDDASKLTVDLEGDMGSIAKQSKDSRYYYSFEPERGYFYLSRPSRIPTYYYGVDGEDPKLPRADATDGRYTPLEAIAEARAYLSSILNIDTSTLFAESIAPESYDKERSHAYRITFCYQYGGVPLLPGYSSGGNLRIYISLTDDGVCDLEGVRLSIEANEKIDTTQLMSPEAVSALHRDRPGIEPEKFSLGYEVKQVDMTNDQAYPVWIYKDTNTAFQSAHIFDAQDGKELSGGGY